MNNFNKMTMIVAIAGFLTLSIIVMASLSNNQVSAQMVDCPTTLSLVSSPRTGTVGSDGTLPVNLLMS